MKKTTQLKKIICSPSLQFVCEAHNGISASIVEEAGFPAIWASGFTISASLGVRDSNEASWTQVLEVLEFMSDKTRIPILVDGDTGFGNFNNVRRLIGKLEQRGIAGVCLEDKLFPKTNSFFAGERQPLADIAEFCGKIKAAKDAQTDPDFCVVARIEAFIAGWGLDEALNRAKAYAQAGADAILVHSKKDDAADLLAFLKAWDRTRPVVIIPTAYGHLPTSLFKDAGVSTVIWANQILRSAVTAMKKTACQIYKTQTIKDVNAEIAPMAEIFRLQDMEELKKAEQQYLPQSRQYRGIILAAGEDKIFGRLTQYKPKCLLKVNGKTILSTLMEVFYANKIKDLYTVVGYKKEAVEVPQLHLIDNKNYKSTGILESLYTAREFLDGPVVISYGDILFAPSVLRDLIELEGDIVLTVDAAWVQGEKPNRDKDVVYCQESFSNKYLAAKTSRVLRIATQKERQGAQGEWIGLMKLTSRGSGLLKQELENFRKKNRKIFKKANLVQLLSWLLQKGIVVTAAYSSGHWLDVDSPEDLQDAKKRTKG